MKILILYFSGTGNTEFVAQYINKDLSCDMFEIEIFPLELFKSENISKYDTLIFGFPVYACDIPVFIQEYLKDIPITKTKSVFIFCTKAISSGIALKHAKEIFEKAGYNPIGYADIKMPGSDGLAFLKKNSPMAHKIINRDFSTIEVVDNLVDRIKEVTRAVENNEVERFCLNVNSNIGSSFYSGILKKLFIVMEGWLKRKFWADNNCIKCKKCERICPANNIKVKEKVSFGSSCYLCMRCIHQCPMEAIQIGKKTVGKFRWRGPLGTYNPK
ncbi:MAG: EFR1 family ferrodoxin [Clostridiaceae bacterium]|nr:EFR1 family ferrodoxin [Clostridiaceae bacterium]